MAPGVEDKREGRAETDKKEKPREVTRAVVFSGVRSGGGGMEAFVDYERP
jgi:hypothetical protein